MSVRDGLKCCFQVGFSDDLECTSARQCLNDIVVVGLAIAGSVDELALQRHFRPLIHRITNMSAT